MAKLERVSASGAFAIVPNDSANLTKYTYGIYVGGTGNLKVDMEDGSTVTYSSVPVGFHHNLRIKKVYATGTTATNLIALI